MKRVSAWILAVILAVFQPVPYAACADRVTGEKIEQEAQAVEENNTDSEPEAEWKISDSVTASCADGVLTFHGSGAVMLDKGWPGWKGRIRRIVVEEGITDLESYLFADMPDVEEVLLPSTLKSIGDYIFRGCRNLQYICLPGEIDTIPEGAFSGCTSLKEIDVNGEIVEIGKKSFFGCLELKNTVNFEDAEVIEQGTDMIQVKNRTAVSSRIPVSGIKVGEEAFYGCRSLGAVLYTDNVTMEQTVFDMADYTKESILRVYCFEESREAAEETFLGEGAQIIVITSPGDMPEGLMEGKQKSENKKTLSPVWEPAAVLAAADNTITYPVMTPYAYAQTDSQFAVINRDTFMMNGEYEFCAQVLYSGKAYEAEKYVTQVAAFGKWDNKEVSDWARRIASGDAELEKAYRDSGILHTARISDDSRKGELGAWYRNIGTYKGKRVDAKATISNYTLYTSGSRQGLGILGLSEDKIGIYAKNISNVTLKIEFYEHGSSTKKIQVKGFALLDDVDYGQGVKVESAYDKLYVQTASTFAVYRNGTMISPVLIDKSGINNTDYYPFAAQVEFHTSTFSYKYYNDRYFYKDGLADAYINPDVYIKSGSWNAYWKNVEPYFVNNFNPGYQGFSARRMAKTSLPYPVLTVTDEDEAAVRDHTLDALKEEFSYTISQNIPKEEAVFYYSDFAVRDTLPECLEFIRAKVMDDKGNDVSSRFLMTHKNQEVVFQVKTPSSSVFYGVTYHFQVYVRVRQAMNYAKWLNDETGFYDVTNRVESTLVRGGAEDSKKSNIVTTHFRDEIPISYHSNYRVKEQETFTETAYRNFPYLVRDNDEKVRFAEDETAVFAGWDLKPEVFVENVSFLKESLPVKVKDYGQMNLYAIWDYAPDISREHVPVFYEGEEITKEMLMRNVVVRDMEDDRQGIELPLDVRRIHSGNRNQVIREYADNMSDSDSFRVSFEGLGKTEEDGDQTLWVTYCTADSAGNKCDKELEIQIRYNNPPEIKASDRTYLLDEVKDGGLTKDKVLSFALATDIEDDEAKASGLIVDGKPVDINRQLKIVGFREDAFKRAGEVLVTYHVADRFGKETFHGIMVSVIDGETEALPDTEGEVRFISGKYYGLAKEDGGLHENSRWYTERDYIDRITDALSNTKNSAGEWYMMKKQWYFTNADVTRVKQYIKDKGIGNSCSPDALAGFLTEFSPNRT